MSRLFFLFSCILFLQGCISITKSIVQHREEYRHEFLTDPRSPLKEEDLVWLDFYPPSKEAVVKADFTITPKEEPFELPTYSGITRTYRKWGVATFQWESVLYSLALYENMTLRNNPAYADYLFLPFMDETNGVETYGGGRYLNMSKEDTHDGKITIDFNACYNPWCAYSDGYNCPIPPKENHLLFPIPAGEKAYKGQHKIK